MSTYTSPNPLDFSTTLNQLAAGQNFATLHVCQHPRIVVVARIRNCPARSVGIPEEDDQVEVGSRTAHMMQEMVGVTR